MNPLLLKRFYEDTAFIMESRLSLMMEAVIDTKFAEHPYYKELRKEMKPEMTVSDSGIATIPIEGVLAYNPEIYEMMYMGVEDSRNILEMLNTAKDDDAIKGVRIAMDSPGGFSTGGFEIADAVKELDSIKPVVSHIGGIGASLGYLIASQARTVVANRSALVGSIGAYRVFTDVSRMAEERGIKVHVFKNKEAIYKAAGVPGTSLTEAQAAHMQQGTQDSFEEFKSMITSTREDIPESAMRGQVFTGIQAKANGLVDRIGDSSFALSILKQCIDGKNK